MVDDGKSKLLPQQTSDQHGATLLARQEAQVVSQWWTLQSTSKHNCIVSYPALLMH
jgi:hypothetical protein